MRALAIIFGTLLFSILAWGEAFAGVQPIDDPQKLLTEAQKAKLNNLLMENYNKTKVHIVVWLPKLEKDDVLLDKAVEYFKQKGIGQKGEDNGVLILVDWNNHRSRIEVGYGLEGTITDVLAKSIQDTKMNPFFKKKDLVGGLTAGIMALSKLSEKNVAEGRPDVVEPKTDEPVDVLWVFIGIVVMCAVGLALFVWWQIHSENERKAASTKTTKKETKKDDDSGSSFLTGAIIGSMFGDSDRRSSSSDSSSSSSSSFDWGGRKLRRRRIR